MGAPYEIEVLVSGRSAASWRRRHTIDAGARSGRDRCAVPTQHGARSDRHLRPRSGRSAMTASVNFCHGFVEGAVIVEEANEADKGVPRLFCLPSPRPPRAPSWQISPSGRISRGRLDMPSIDGVFVYLTQKFPCPAETSTRRRSRMKRTHSRGGGSIGAVGRLCGHDPDPAARAIRHGDRRGRWRCYRRNRRECGPWRRYRCGRRPCGRTDRGPVEEKPISLRQRRSPGQRQ